MAKGGRMVYCGPMALVPTYFEAVLGYTEGCPHDTAPLDWVMDVCDGKHGLGVAMGRWQVAAAAAGGVAETGGKGDDAAPLFAADGVVDAASVSRAMQGVWRERGEAWVATQQGSSSSGDTAGSGVPPKETTCRGGRSGLAAYATAYSLRPPSGAVAAMVPTPLSSSSASTTETSTGPPPSSTTTTSGKIVSLLASSRGGLGGGGWAGGIAGGSKRGGARTEIGDLFALPPPPKALLARVCPPRPSFLAQLVAFTYRTLLQ